jgi:hypothetical protein
MIKIDATLLIQIQLALVGILVVVGIFYVWRSIVRLENKVDKSFAKLVSVLKQTGPSNDIPSSFPFPLSAQYQSDPSSFAEDIANAQEIMHQVFGNGMNLEQPQMASFSFGVFEPEINDDSTTTCVVEEIESTQNPSSSSNVPLAPVKEALSEMDDNNNEDNNDANDENDENDDVSVTTDTNPMSKSKLSQMKLEKLRELCSARELSIEGTKPQLIERLLGLSRE